MDQKRDLSEPGCLQTHPKPPFLAPVYEKMAYGPVYEPMGIMFDGKII